MNKKTWGIIAIIAIAIAIVFIIVKKHNNNSIESETDDFDYTECQYTNEIESGEDLFCYYMSADKYPDEPFFADMVELYNASVLVNGIKSVVDVWYRYESSEDALESLKHADVSILKNDDIRAMVTQYLQLTTTVVSQDLSELDTVAYKQFIEYSDLVDSTLATRYNISNYAKLSDEEYWGSMNYRNEADDLYKKLRCKRITPENNESSDAEKDIKLMLEKIKKEKDFSKKCSYTMAYTSHVDYYYIAFDVIEPLLDDGRYSPYLFFLWRIWRCGEQLSNPCYGPSTWSVIPNKIYNEKRFKVAEATLNYIVKHREDAVAINQFLMTSSMNNILRLGQYPFGNESFTELYYLGLVDLGSGSEEELAVEE